MLNRPSRMLLVAPLATLLMAQRPLAYPLEGNTPDVIPPGYSQEHFVAEKMSHGDLQFLRHYPKQLTEAERFTLFGCGPDSAKHYGPLLSEIFYTLENYHYATGELPPAITPEVISTARLAGGNAPRPIDLELHRSPITGEYPRLDAAEFSPGDMYVRILTPAEIQHMSKYDGSLRDLLRGKRPGDTGDGDGKSALISDVYYFRIYGEHETIYADLHYAWI